MAYPQLGDDISDYGGHLRQYYCGLAQRAQFALGCGAPWPRSNEPRETGVAGAVVLNGDGTLTMTDASDPPKSWVMPSGPGITGTKRWLDFHSLTQCFLPALHDVVFSAGGLLGETKVVRGHVTDHSAGLAHETVTFDGKDVRNAITGGYLPSLAALAGVRYDFIKKGGQWFSGFDDSLSRWFAFPNDRELFRSRADAGSDKFLRSLYNRAAGTTVPQGWRPDQWAGQECLCYSGELLKRIPIVWNDKNALYFVPKPGAGDPPMPEGWADPAPAFAVDADYFSIVPPGARGLPARWAGKPHWAAGEAKEQAAAVKPDTSAMGAVFVPAHIVQWDEGSPCIPPGDPCEPVNHDADLVDLWSAAEEQCGAPLASDKNYSPDYFKAPRGLQTECLALWGYYADPVGLSAGGASALTDARGFRAADINWATGAVAEPSPDAFECAVPAEWNGHLVYWTVLNADKTNRLSGRAIAAAGKIGLSSELWNATEAAVDPDNRTNDVGKTVVVSAGFTREHPYELRLSRPAGPILIPDLDDEGNPIDTPAPASLSPLDCSGVGRYEERAASTSYAVADAYDDLVDGGEPLEVGRVVRLAGNSAEDAGVSASPYGGRMSIADPLAPYYARFWEGTHKPAVEGALDLQRRGAATGGDFQSLTDATKNFLLCWYGTAGVARTEHLTATAGAVDWIQDAAAVASPSTNPRACYWQGGRWPDGRPFRGQVMTVTGGANAGAKRLVGDGDPATGKLWPAAPFPFPIVAGVTADVVELRHANTLRGGILRVWNDPGSPGSFVDVPILGNDATTIFYSAAAELTVAAGMRYEVIIHRPGGVWVISDLPPADPLLPYIMLAPTRWLIKPTGADPRGRDWVPDARFDLPHKKKRFGFHRRGDYVTLNVKRELWRAINVMKYAIRPLTWSAYASADAEFMDVNERSASYSMRFGELFGDDCATRGYTTEADLWPCMRDSLTDLWNGIDIGEQHRDYAQVGDLPGSFVEKWFCAADPLSDGSYDASVIRRYAYAYVQGVPRCYDPEVAIWVVADKYFSDEFTDPSYQDNQFDTLGDGDFSEDVWAPIASEGAGTDGETDYYRVGYTGAVDGTGPHDMPALGGDPPHDCTDVMRGWRVRDGVAIIKGTFTCCAGAVPPDA